MPTRGNRRNGKEKGRKNAPWTEKGRKLSEKQMKFCQSYAGNAQAALREAGYRGNYNTMSKTAWEFMRDPRILATIKDIQEKRTPVEIVKLDAKKEKEHRQFLRRQHLEMLMNRITPYRKSFVSDASVLRAIELLGKMDGDYVDNLNLNVKKSYEEMVEEATKDLKLPETELPASEAVVDVIGEPSDS